MILLRMLVEILQVLPQLLVLEVHFPLTLVLVEQDIIIHKYTYHHHLMKIFPLLEFQDLGLGQQPQLVLVYQSV